MDFSGLAKLTQLYTVLLQAFLPIALVLLVIGAVIMLIPYAKKFLGGLTG